MQSPVLSAVRVSLLRVRRQWRNSPVGWIHDERGSPGGYDPATVAPELVVSASNIGCGTSVSAIRITLFEYSLFVRDRFFCGKKLFSCKLRRSFQRRHSGVVPYSLQ